LKIVLLFTQTEVLRHLFAATRFCKVLLQQAQLPQSWKLMKLRGINF